MRCWSYLWISRFGFIHFCHQNNLWNHFLGPEHFMRLLYLVKDFFFPRVPAATHSILWQCPDFDLTFRTRQTTHWPSGTFWKMIRLALYNIKGGSENSWIKYGGTPRGLGRSNAVRWVKPWPGIRLPVSAQEIIAIIIVRTGTVFLMPLVSTRQD